MNTTKDLRRHLRRAIIDHVSDAFLDTRTPLMNLIDAARRGDRLTTEASAKYFQVHSDKIVNVRIFMFYFKYLIFRWLDWLTNCLMM